MAYLPTMAAFWVGPYLSWIDQIGLLSFVRHGHRVILYTRGEVKNVPEGIEVRPASEVWDSVHMPIYKAEEDVVNHPAALTSDFFGWHLQKKTEYFYMNTDRICLRPFDRWPHEELMERGCWDGMAFMRFPRNSLAVDLVLKLISQKHPVLPWFSREGRWKLWRRKLTGRGVTIDYMKWGSGGRHVGDWALAKTGKTEMFIWIEPYIIYDARLVFLSKSAVEPMFSGDALMLSLHWPLIYYWQPDFLDNPPADSWIAHFTKELGVVVSDAPVLETRKANKEYLDEQNNDPSLLL